MKIYKFGGASIKDAAAMQNVVSIIEKHQPEIGLVVVSALGKTTNGLEKVVNCYHKGQQAEAEAALSEIRGQHWAIVEGLGLSPKRKEALIADLEDMLVEVDWILETEPIRGYDYYYDQIVSVGELLSTKMIAALLEQANVAQEWVDVRDVLRTDDNYRAANIQWAATQELINGKIRPLIGKKLLITQGFIGSTDDNCTTTLAREGSDYTAAIFAYCLDAEEMVIWKDVEGVLNADPRLFPQAQLIPALGYEEAIEMTYYGAQVIHPKTLQPLQAKKIPLRVRSFIHQEQQGSTVSQQANPAQYPAIVVLKTNQTLLYLRSLDMEFIDEQRLGQIFGLLGAAKLKTNMSQHSALGFWAAVNTEAEKLAFFTKQLPDYYQLNLTDGLELLTLRHCSPAQTSEFISQKTVFLRGSSEQTQQFLVSIS